MTVEMLNIVEETNDLMTHLISFSLDTRKLLLLGIMKKTIIFLPDS